MSSESGLLNLAVVKSGVNLKGNGEDVKVVQELMRHANSAVTLNIMLKQSRNQSEMHRAASLLLDKNEEKPRAEAYRTYTIL